MLSPFKGRFRVTSAYGQRTGKYAGFHAGLDIVGDDDKTVYAIKSGVVMTSTRIPYVGQSDRTYEWGNYVKIKHDDGKYAFYCHLASRAVSIGMRINQGDMIGVMGGTGKYDNSYSPHLHLEIRDSNNKVTPTCNTPAYTGIPNIENKAYEYTSKEEHDLTREETIALIKEMTKVKTYDTIASLPTWAKPEIEYLISKGVKIGKSATELGLTETELKALCWDARGMQAEKVYHTIEELPSWAKDDIDYLINRGVSIGKSENDLGLTETNLKALCWDAREMRSLDK